MKNILLSGAACLALASGVNAQEIKGGAVSLMQYMYEGGIFTWQNTQIQGQIEFGFGPSFGAQFDLGIAGWDDQPISQNSIYGAHVFYNLGESAKVGAFYGGTFYDGGENIEEYYGLEGQYEAGPLAIQAYYVAKIAYDGVVLDDRYILGTRADYDFGNVFGPGDVSLFGHYSTFSSPFTDVVIYGAGMRYGFGNGIFTELELGETFRVGTPITSNRVSLTIGWEFGDGPSFERRDYFSILKGY